jgi:hypothetical protein
MPWARGFPVLAAGKVRVGNYTCHVLENGDKRVHRMGASDGSVRVIPRSRRCECKFQKAYVVQCRHEIAAEGGTFVKEAFALRWWKREALPPGIWDLDEDSLPAFETMGSDASVSPPSEENVGDSTCTSEYAHRASEIG